MELMAEGKRGHGSGDVPVFEYTAQRATHYACALKCSV